MTRSNSSFQGGYDGTHFLANVEVYDPVKDVWEDGIPLTSGRSGLASAVIYQPSCHQNYSPDCIANISSNREYDDDKKPPDHHDDDADISSRGTGSSFHLNCSSNFFSGHSGGQFDDVELRNSNEIRERLSDSLYDMMTVMNEKLTDHCENNEPCSSKKDLIHQEFNDNHMVRLAKFHMKCNKHPASTCPLQLLKRRFRSFMHNRKNKNSTDKFCKPEEKPSKYHHN